MTEPVRWVVLVVRVTPEQHAKLTEYARDRKKSAAWVVRSLVERLEAPKV